MRYISLYITIFSIIASYEAIAQISPGDLAEPHAELEGIGNCTKCHVLGEEVTNDKCLDCHKALKTRIDRNSGYHSSKEVKNKGCISCHSDHNGRKFDMNRFNEQDFDHQLAGYELTGQHKSIDCRDCHKPDLITDADLKKNKTTFLGLNQGCISCHEDVHQKTLSEDCAKCHVTDDFSPPVNFSHNNADFKLLGQHKQVACIECHKLEKRDGRDFQRFTDIEFRNCTACHTDVHNNKFGQNCKECHNESSFRVANFSSNFEHDKTGFNLEGQHKFIDCKECHITNYTSPLEHGNCASCHKDYHNNEFAAVPGKPDCAECHSVNGFTSSLYTIEKHNEGKFILDGAHLATPCFACHKQEDRWKFRKIGEKCVDCHEDIHKGSIDEKYYPDQDCKICHSVTNWKKNQFDHGLTDFELSGIHSKQDCGACHGIEEVDVVGKYRNFTNVSTTCVSCHDDIHRKQFEREGETDCGECHGFEGWHSIDYNHNNTAFMLEGKHLEAECRACHKEKEDEGEIFVVYKIKSFECVDCHQ